MIYKRKIIRLYIVRLIPEKNQTPEAPASLILLDAMKSFREEKVN